jgi:hypothetical protein
VFLPMVADRVEEEVVNVDHFGTVVVYVNRRNRLVFRCTFFAINLTVSSGVQ